MKSLAEFKRTLEPGMLLRVTYFKDDQQIQVTERRTVVSVSPTQFVTERPTGSQPYMPFGKASEWEFGNCIAGWAAIRTDPHDPRYQVQHVYVEEGF